MLVTLEQIKTYLGITGTDHDDTLTYLGGVVTAVVQKETGRVLEPTDFTDTFIRQQRIWLQEYPLIQIDEIRANGDVWDPDRVFADPNVGHLFYQTGSFKSDDFPRIETLEIDYRAGYDPLPMDLEIIVLDSVEMLFNQKQNGDAGLGAGIDSVNLFDMGSIKLTHTNPYQAG